jgi:hypothetical protein
MFVARAERVIAVSPERAFDRLADLSSWSSWMPKSFRPAGSTAGRTRLEQGDTFKVRIARMPMPSKLKVSASDRPRELSWRGGLRGVLAAEHRFLFDAEGDGKTRVRSVETWTGALAGVLRRFVDPVATKVGGQQLEALARSLEVS